MNVGVNRFYNSLTEAAKIPDRVLVGLFVYFITVENGEESATSKAVADAFRERKGTVSQEDWE